MSLRFSQFPDGVTDPRLNALHNTNGAGNNKRLCVAGIVVFRRADGTMPLTIVAAYLRKTNAP